MTRNCAVCRRPFEASRPNAKFCGSTCRKRNARGVTAPEMGSNVEAESDEPTPLVEATTAELAAAGKLDTMLGQLALALAKRMGGEVTGIAALSKELRSVTDAALGVKTSGASAVADDVDELRARRDAKRVG